jgi:BTB/POZ domain
VLCTQSSWFAKACEGPFQEASQATIELFDDEHPEAIESMLKYCYGVWPGVTGDSRTSAERIRHSAYVFAAADKYDVVGLREHMIGDFRREVKEEWMDLWECGELAGVVNAAYEYAVDVATNPLCAIVIEGVSKHLKRFREQDQRRLRALLDECPELATDLVLKLASGAGISESGEVWGSRGDNVLVVEREEVPDGPRSTAQDEGGVNPNAAAAAGMGGHFRSFCGIRT